MSAHGGEAHLVGLRHVSDGDPGIRRLGRPPRQRYVDAEGRPLRDAETLARIQALAIPPAWRDVWICTDPRGHLQAVGRDARGRKQYRYHATFARLRDADKHGRLLRFARRLPRIREAVESDLARPGLPREKVLALVVRLLELTHLRVGIEECARLNRSYGLTTLQDRHTTVRGSAIRFHFRGKSGKEQDVGIRDRRLARLVRRIQELPGQRLFEYLDADETRRAIHSDDVNAYLREISGTNATAKDFRTWAATVFAFRLLRAEPPATGDAQARRRIKAAIEQVAGRLGNTTTVCRASYVHPVVVDAWATGDLARVRVAADVAGETIPDPAAPLSPEEEAAVIRLLERAAGDSRERARRGRGAAAPGPASRAGGSGRSGAQASAPVSAPSISSRPRSSAPSSGRRRSSRTSVTPGTDSTTPSR